MNAVNQADSSRRRRTTTHAAAGRKPQQGARFPSQVFGENLRILRQMRKMRQSDLAKSMNAMGFAGWSRVTVSDIERGLRATGVDELVALAYVLKSHVANLMDPCLSGDREAWVDVLPIMDRGVARDLVLDSADPWAIDSDPGRSFARHQERLQALVDYRDKIIDHATFKKIYEGDAE